MTYHSKLETALDALLTSRDDNIPREQALLVIDDILSEMPELEANAWRRRTQLRSEDDLAGLFQAENKELVKALSAMEQNNPSIVHCPSCERIDKQCWFASRFEGDWVHPYNEMPIVRTITVRPDGTYYEGAEDREEYQHMPPSVRARAEAIPTQPILDFLKRWQGRWATHGSGHGYMPSVSRAMPEGVDDDLALAKMRLLWNDGLVHGCPCGCRGDWEI